MKRFFASFFVVLLPIVGLAQEFSVGGIVEMSGDSTAVSSPRFDINDDLCAVLLVEIESINDVSFSGSIVGEVERKNDTYILYLADGTKRIRLMHEDYLPLTLEFPQYDISIKGGKTYKVSLTASKLQSKSNAYGSGAQYLVFKSTVPLTKVMVNGDEWPVENGTARKMVPLGKYEYTVESADSVVKGSVDVKSTFASKVVNVKFD